MFVGHIAVALAGKRKAPAVNLAWLVAGVTALDLLWPVFLLTGIESATVQQGATAFTPIVFDSYPWSHSLVMSVVWGIVLVAIARAAGLPSAATPLLVLMVVSHWFLDFFTHAPDMPLWPGSAKYGLGLWNSIPATLIVEGAIWIVGIAMYLRVRKEQGARVSWWFWSLVGITTLMWASGPFQSPPSQSALGWFALVGWIMVPWAWLADRART